MLFKLSPLYFWAASWHCNYYMNAEHYGSEVLLVERHSIKKCWNRALCDKSVKFGTHVQNPIRNKSGYWVTFDLTFGDL